MQYRFKKSRLFAYYPIVRRQQRIFESKLGRIKMAVSDDEKIAFIADAVDFAVKNGTGYYSSQVIEDACIELAETIHSDCGNIKYEAGSVLHVMTTAYKVGGHSRVVERWIKADGKTRNHSIVITNQKDNDCPQWLEDICNESGGRLISLYEDDLLKRAKTLRLLAMHYEYVVLHIHMNDIVPIVAFGVKEFKRPVILFNHADHLFWVGISIADVVADFRDLCNFTKERRRAQNIFCLGLPFDYKNEDIPLEEKKKARKDLGIPETSFVILTTGAAFKYAPIGKHDFSRLMQKVINANRDVACYAIGPSVKWTNWREANEITHKVFPVGIVADKNLYTKYLKSADLYVDSYPMSGGTSIRDAVMNGLPVLSIQISAQENNHFSENPFFVGAECNCKNESEFLKKCLKATVNEEYRDMLRKEASVRFEDGQCDLWKKRLEDLMALCPAAHSVYSFSNVKGRDVVIDDNSVLLYHFYKEGLMTIPGEIKKYILKCFGKRKRY